ncbi:MAG: methyltransferase domain-containing protein [Luteitalea sp.]|nr:methyltransferase domain-containing protein [Luteitalea sp.]
MQSATILNLITKGVQRGDAAWADFGSGEGRFTRALRALLGPDADIYTVDVDASTLERQRRTFGTHADVSRTHFVEADFTQPLDLPPLDGVLLANALHFIKDQTTMLKQLRAYLKPSGRLLVIEYDITRGSVWVPYPLPFRTLARLAPAAGFQQPVLLATTPSRFRSQIYSALVLHTSYVNDGIEKWAPLGDSLADRGGDR